MTRISISTKKAITRAMAEGDGPSGKSLGKLQFVNNLNFLSKMTIEASSSVAKPPITWKAEDLSSTKGLKNYEPLSKALQSSKFSLKLLFAKDLLKFTYSLSTPKKSLGDGFFSKENKLVFKQEIDENKNLKKELSKAFDSNMTKAEISKSMKKEFSSIEKKLMDFFSKLTADQKTLKKLITLMQSEIKFLSSDSKEIPKVRMQILYSEVIRLKLQLSHEDLLSDSTKTPGKALNNSHLLLSSKTLSHSKSTCEGKGFSRSHIHQSQQAFSTLISLYHALLELKKAMAEGEGSSLFIDKGLVASLQTRVLIPFGIVFPFTSFKQNNLISKFKKKKEEEFDEDDELNDENPFNKKDK